MASFNLNRRNGHIWMMSTGRDLRGQKILPLTLIQATPLRNVPEETGTTNHEIRRPLTDFPRQNG